MKNEIPGPKNKGSEDSRRKGHRNIGAGGGDDAVPEVVPDVEARTGLVERGWIVRLRERERYGATRRGNRRNDLLS